MKMLEIQVLEENMFEDDRIDFIYLEPNAIKSIERNNGLLCTIRMQNGDTYGCVEKFKLVDIKTQKDIKPKSAFLSDGEIKYRKKK